MRSPVEICVMTCLLQFRQPVAFKALRETLYLLQACSIANALALLKDTELVDESRSEYDGRKMFGLTEKGRKEFSEIELTSSNPPV